MGGVNSYVKLGEPYMCVTSVIVKMLCLVVALGRFMPYTCRYRE